MRQGIVKHAALAACEYLRWPDSTTTSVVVVAAVGERLRALEPLLARWNELATQHVPALNRQLKAAGLAEVSVGR